MSNNDGTHLNLPPSLSSFLIKMSDKCFGCQVQTYKETFSPVEYVATGIIMLHYPFAGFLSFVTELGGEFSLSNQVVRLPKNTHTHTQK